MSRIRAEKRMAQAGERVSVITGGAGFIGSNLADELLRRGERVVVYDDLSRAGTERNLRWLRRRHPERLSIELGDVRDAAHLRRVIARAKTVYHLAAQVAVTSSVSDPVLDFSVNATGTLNVLEAARRLDDPPVILFTSTNKVYGDLSGVPITGDRQRYRFAGARRGIGEDQPLSFHSPYGCSKGAADQYMCDFARIYDLPTVVLRMSCIYGPRQFGTEDQGWVAHFIIAALSGQPVTVYGDGLQVRDVLYIDDLIEAMDRGVEAAESEPGRVYNVGGGPDNAVSLLEVLGVLEQVLGQRVEREFAPWRPGDQRVYISDIERIGRELGWRPRVTKEEGLRRLATWMQENVSMVQSVRPRRVEQPLSA